MKRRTRTTIAAMLLTMGALAGCAHVPKDHGIDEVRGLVQERAAQDLRWAYAEDEDAAATLAALVEEPLTAESATQIALLRNPDVAIAFAELGLSRADLVEAGTLPNPTLFGMARFVTGSGSGTNGEVETVFPILDALMVPLRRKIETQHFEHAKLRAAGDVLALLADVRAAYYDAFSAQQELELVALSREASSATAAIARRQYDAGNLSRLARLSHEAFDVRVGMEARELKAEAVEKEQRLRRVLGLGPGDAGWFWPMRYPEPGAVESDPFALEGLAISRRLDLAAAAHEVEAMEFALKLARRFRYTGMIDLGVSGEREPDGEWVVGPTLELEVPIFDRKRGEVLRTQSMLDRSRAEREALELDIRTGVHAAAERLAEARDRLDAYTRDLLPMHGALVEESQLHYNGMLIGVYDLLEAKQAELETRRGAMAARLDYWLAHTELERLTEGQLPEASSPAEPAEAPSTEAAPTNASDEHEHHHEE